MQRAPISVCLVYKSIHYSLWIVDIVKSGKYKVHEAIIAAEKHSFKNNLKTCQGWSNGSAIKTTSCSSRGLQFSSQYTHGVFLVPRALIPTQQTYMQAVHIRVKKSFKSVLKDNNNVL